MNTFYANKFYFIVSHRNDRDDNDVSDLYRNVSHRCQQQGFLSQYLKVSSRKEFSNAIGQIESDTKSGLLPYIHIDTHGSDKGIILAQGGLINWQVLISFFAKINLACKDNLFVSFATCWGGSFLVELIKKAWKGHDARSPIGGFIGPSKKLYLPKWKNFNEYFDTLLCERDLNKAYNQLLDSSEDEQIYVFTTSELLFKDFLDVYVEYILVPKYQSYKSYHKYLLELESKHFQHSGRPLTPNELRILFDFTISEKEFIKIFNTVREKFFMIDLYKENRNRFDEIERITNWDEMIRDLKKSLIFQLF